MEPSLYPLTDEKHPKLTIGVPVYNSENCINGCLQSLLNQSYKDFVIIVSDNKSTDATLSIIKDLATKEPQIRVFEQKENVGIINNYNFVKDLSNSEYFMWAASDDRWGPSFIETIINGLEKETDVILGFTPYVFVDQDGSKISKTRIFDYYSKNVIVRVIKHLIHYDDAIIYGIFRLKFINNQNFPTWWGKNRSTPYNVAFPLIIYSLAKGNSKIFGIEPLWFNCIKQTQHYQPHKNSIFLFFLLFLFRKINLLFLQFAKIYQGTNSIITATILAPFLLLRLVMDIFEFFVIAIRKSILNKTIRSN